MARRNLYWLFGISAITLLGMAVSYSSPTSEANKEYENVRLMVEVLHQVRQKYVNELTPQRERELIEDMINGGLERLDPHSAYINPTEYKQFTKQSEGKFGGIGIQIGYDPQNRGQLSVISPMPGTPAYEAGILAGDIILKVDGKSIEDMRMSEVVELIQGDPGEKVILTVLHEGGKKTVDIPITRAIIEVHSILGDTRKKDDPEKWEWIIDPVHKIGYLRLTAFSETVTDELVAVLKEMQAKGVRGLIIDLRNNPGGLLRKAVEVSNLFLTQGKIVSTKGRYSGEDIYEATEKGTMFLPAETFPIAVLINKYSASASEIVAAALQDHKRAIVVGERSFGKGSVQNVIMMENATSALKLTTASYWRPNGKNIHRFPDSKLTDEWGVTPNKGFAIKMTDDERLDYLLYRSDRDVVRNGKKPDTKKDEKKKFVDRALQKAVEYLRTKIRN